MDAEIKQAVDTAMLDDIDRGYRIKDVPDYLMPKLEHAAREAGFSPFRKIRFVQLTLRKKRQIAEATQLRYFADLKNNSLLSNAEIVKLNIERGEWSIENGARMKELDRQVTALMQELYLGGMDPRSEWRDEIIELAALIRGAMTTDTSAELEANRSGALAIFDRWLAYTDDLQGSYSEQYGAEHGGVYGHDTDLQYLMQIVPYDLNAELRSLADYHEKLRKFGRLVQLQDELNELRKREASMLADSVEQRKETAETLARIFYSTERVDDKMKTLVPSLDHMWDLPDDVIQWLMYELYFFNNNVPDIARDYLQKWGFLPAPPASGPSAPSGALRAEPTSSTAMPSPTATPPASSEFEAHSS